MSERFPYGKATQLYLVRATRGTLQSDSSELGVKSLYRRILGGVHNAENVKDGKGGSGADPNDVKFDARYDLGCTGWSPYEITGESCLCSLASSRSPGHSIPYSILNQVEL